MPKQPKPKRPPAGQRLRAARLAKEHTYAVAGEKLGCHPATVANIELGKRGVGRVLARMIQEVYGIDRDDW